MTKILLATNNGVVFAEQEEKGWTVSNQTLSGETITSIETNGKILIAGTKEGIQRSVDGGKNWLGANNGLTIPHIRWLKYHPNIKNKVFAGTEPAGIFVSHKNGITWTNCIEVEYLREQDNWSLPYSPEAGCVRGFAFHSDIGYAAVEVGGVLKSENQGDNWKLAQGSEGKPTFSSPPKGFVHPDVHSLFVHPTTQDLVFAPTGGGLYGSKDGGITWEFLYNCYCRAIWVDPINPAILILGPADGVGRNGRIEISRDGGNNWESASEGLNTPWANAMPERFTQIGDVLFCVMDDGRLLTAPLETLVWEHILEDVEGVNAVIPID